MEDTEPRTILSLDNITNPEQKKLLETFLATGNLDQAIGMARSTKHRHYVWLDIDPVYRELYYRECDMITDSLSDIAVDRAKSGYTEKTVVRQGQREIVTEFHKHDNALLMKLLTLRKGEKHPINKWMEPIGPVSLADACRKLAIVLDQMSSGSVTTESAGAMSRLAMAMTHLVQVGEMEDRIKAIEERIGEEPV